MKLLFSMRHFGYARSYERALSALAARGHEIVVAAEQREMGPGLDPGQLAARCPEVRWTESPEPEPSQWPVLARCIRTWLDFLRFSAPAYASAPKYRARVEDKMPRALRRVARLQADHAKWLTGVVTRTLRAMERALPVNRALDQFLDEQAPDLVLLTPLLYLGSSQADMLKSAKAQGRKTGLCVASWDHLSSKSFIRELPDRVFVWNDTQRREAIELHGVPPDRIAVTGAQCFDHWFDWQPSRSRQTFCDLVGLPADRPVILYVCSALLVHSPPEPELVHDWIAQVRQAASPAVREAGILVRPHPSRVSEWAGIDWPFPHVSIWGSNPVDTAGKDDYFDSLHHCAAVVGVNTSAFLEAAILGKPVLSIVLPEFCDNQDGTLHFRYLTDIAGGLVQVAPTLEEHVTQLDQEITAPAPNVSRHAAFVTSFIRPNGLARSANDTFVEEVERLAADPRVAVAPSRAASPAEAVLRRVMRPIAVIARAAFEDELLRIDRGVRKERERRDRAAEREAYLRRKAELHQQALTERADLVRRREAARQARLDEQARVRRANQAAHDALRREKEQRKQERWADKRRRDRDTRRAVLFQKIKRLLHLTPSP